MKSLITSTVVCTAVAGYFIFESIQLSFSEGAYAGAGGRGSAQLQTGQEAQFTEPGKKVQGVKDDVLLDGSEMMEFEGDIFADVPEHMGTEDGDGGSSQRPTGDDNQAGAK
ncbi:hypothetical protein [Microbulbifer sp. 2205BS26-8]|uniref:hypothetical protein n=1 Tax=Microbulbifer sp. 2205BS26-8 TaxID=3064386 RepID=UPI002740103F|nr:hypothetical protein [Microbulbifer sp. 2205BS26-8]MDP5209737.1 hypothetical protein [Microbulbifer sp. 2205BS26-8]